MAASKLVFYNHTGEVSGAEVVLLAILRGLDRARFSPVLFCPQGSLIQAANLLDVEHIGVPALQARFTFNPIQLASYLLSIVTTVRSIREHFKSANPDLIHANSVRAGLVATLAGAGLGVPVIWHIHDILPTHPVTTVIRTIAAHARNTVLLAVTHATANSFSGGSSARFPKPIAVVYNSVDLDRFQPDYDPEARKLMRRELDLTEQQIAVGVIGQLTPRKRQLELIEAFAHARGRMPNTILLIIGAAQFQKKNRVYADRLAQRIQELGLQSQVRLIGKRQDMPAVINALDLLAQNSSNEPMGLALMEGFACARTAAATAVHGVPEILDNGVTGLLTNPDDPADLIRSIELLVLDADLRQQMGLRARQKMIAQFSPALQRSRMQAFYDSVLQTRDQISAPVHTGGVPA